MFPISQKLKSELERLKVEEEIYSYTQYSNTYWTITSKMKGLTCSHSNSYITGFNFGTLNFKKTGIVSNNNISLVLKTLDIYILWLSNIIKKYKIINFTETKMNHFELTSIDKTVYILDTNYFYIGKFKYTPDYFSDIVDIKSIPSDIISIIKSYVEVEDVYPGTCLDFRMESIDEILKSLLGGYF